MLLDVRHHQRAQRIRARVQIGQIFKLLYRLGAVAGVGSDLAAQQVRLFIFRIEAYDFLQRVFGRIQRAFLIQPLRRRQINIAGIVLAPQLHEKVRQLALHGGVVGIQLQDFLEGAGGIF